MCRCIRVISLQRVVTPISTVLRAATRVILLYAADVGVAWVWLTVLLHILPKLLLGHDEILPWSQGDQQLSSVAVHHRQCLTDTGCMCWLQVQFILEQPPLAPRFLNTFTCLQLPCINYPY